MNNNLKIVEGGAGLTCSDSSHLMEDIRPHPYSYHVNAQNRLE